MYQTTSIRPDWYFTQIDKQKITWVTRTLIVYYQYIQVQFKEGTFQPPDIKSSIDLPQDVEIFGQRINLSPVQQALSPLQEVAASISRTISGQQSLKVPIPGEQTQSWLLTTYLDEDFRISRGDGGLFVLAKEGSPLLEQ